MLGSFSSWFGSGPSQEQQHEASSAGEGAQSNSSSALSAVDSVTSVGDRRTSQPFSDRKTSLGFLGIDAVTATGLKDASLAMLKTVTSEAAAAIEDGIAACVFLTLLCI